MLSFISSCKKPAKGWPTVKLVSLKPMCFSMLTTIRDTNEFISYIFTTLVRRGLFSDIAQGLWNSFVSRPTLNDMNLVYTLYITKSVSNFTAYIWICLHDYLSIKWIVTVRNYKQTSYWKFVNLELKRDYFVRENVRSSFAFKRGTLGKMLKPSMSFFV